MDVNKQDDVHQRATELVRGGRLPRKERVELGIALLMDRRPLL